VSLEHTVFSYVAPDYEHVCPFVNCRSYSILLVYPESYVGVYCSYGLTSNFVWQTNMNKEKLREYSFELSVPTSEAGEKRRFAETPRQIHYVDVTGSRFFLGAFSAACQYLEQKLEVEPYSGIRVEDFSTGSGPIWSGEVSKPYVSRAQAEIFPDQTRYPLFPVVGAESGQKEDQAAA